jgi:CBS domain-containing protein
MKEDRMKVQDVMSEHVRTCGPSTNLAAAAMMMWDGDCGFLPVVEGERLVGVITDRDICMGAATHDRPAFAIEVQESMHRDVESCHPQEDVREALERLAAAEIRRMPVVDGGRLVGVLSINDVIRRASRRNSKKALSYGDVVGALQHICQPRQLELVHEKEAARARSRSPRPAVESVRGGSSRPRTERKQP